MADAPIDIYTNPKMHLTVEVKLHMPGVRLEAVHLEAAPLLLDALLAI